MAKIKTQKNELEYDTTTKQGIFNERNYTAEMPTDPFPRRFVTQVIDGQLNPPTNLSIEDRVLSWTASRYAESYDVYLDDVFKENVTDTSIDLSEVDVLVGEHTLSVVAINERYSPSEKATTAFNKYSITTNVTSGTASGATAIFTGDTDQRVLITPTEGYKLPETITVIGASYIFTEDLNIGTISLSAPTTNVVITVVCEKVDTSYTIGFTGMSTAGPALTRTGSAVGATWSATGGIISIDGIDMSKIWGGYVGNDGEVLTFDTSTKKYMYNGSEYTGNVFTKINHFYVKPIYNGTTLDGFDLTFASSNPDESQYQDWFFGKDHIIVGCYKSKNITGLDALVSKQCIVYSSSVNANNIVASYKLNSSTVYRLHEKWYNENAILQVLFMAIFATRQTEDVFPQNTYRQYNNTTATGICDDIRVQSLFGYTTSGSSGANANIFLGIEDFVGFGYELVAGVKLSGTTLQASTDYANFSYSNSYTSSDVNLGSITSGQYIKTVQLSSTNVGLFIPKEGTGSTSTATEYFCDKCWTGNNCRYQGADSPSVDYGLFYFGGDLDSSYSIDASAGRLCGIPA